MISHFVSFYISSVCISCLVSVLFFLSFSFLVIIIIFIIFRSLFKETMTRNSVKTLINLWPSKSFFPFGHPFLFHLSWLVSFLSVFFPFHLSFHLFPFNRFPFLFSLSGSYCFVSLIIFVQPFFIDFFPIHFFS